MLHAHPLRRCIVEDAKTALDTVLGKQDETGALDMGERGRARFSYDFRCLRGTGVVSYLMRRMGKEVHYIDYLRFNYYIGLALIENNNVTLAEHKVRELTRKGAGIPYRNFIQDNFREIYYTDEENLWLDITIQNIEKLGDTYQRALAYYALFQSALVKRPFSLFHRKNLYIRLAHVDRSFGNKAT